VIPEQSTSVPSSYRNIASATTTTVKSGKGILVAIIVNKPVASSTVTIYDNTAGSGTKIGTITQPGTLLESQIVLPYNAQFETGLTIVTSAADDLTVLYL
jgi:hypothetical protein